MRVLISLLNGLTLAYQNNQKVDPNCPEFELNQLCTDLCVEKTFECITNCDPTDSQCITTCLRAEVTCVDQCPCGGDCTAGCEGCENPICKPSKAVLMLSTYKSSNVPMVIDYEGNVDDDIDFTFDTGTAVWSSCTATLHDEFWVIGGDKARRQLSKIQDCKLTKVGELDFDFRWGGCNTFSFGILFCFSEYSKNCYSFDGTTVKNEASSKYDHQRVNVLGVYKRQPFVTGSNTGNVKTEIMGLASKQWNEAADYPFSTGDRIAYYATTSTKESVYILGGFNNDLNTSRSTSIIAEYKNDQWFNRGNLSQIRYGHGAITFDHYSGAITMVLGGSSEDYQPNPTEIWKIEKLESQIIAPSLKDPDYREMGLFLVDIGYCKKN